MAAWHGHRDAVQLLINTGACSNAINKKHYTLLMCAAKNNRLDVVDYLLETLEDVRIDALDLEGQSALFHASMGGHFLVVRRLVEAGSTADKRNKVSHFFLSFNRLFYLLFHLIEFELTLIIFKFKYYLIQIEFNNVYIGIN